MRTPSYRQVLKTALVVSGLLLGSGVAQADMDLIRQVESLRDSLPLKDSAQRRQLTNRLANLYYSESLNLDGDDVSDQAVMARLEGHRQRAVQLYETFLSGEEGRYAAPSGEQRAGARFHLARLYADSNRGDEAKAIWEDLVKDPSYPKIVSETALSLAELYEAEDAASERALELYGIALEKEQKHDTRIYSHYRRAWIYRNQSNFAEAIKELEKSLYDSKGQVKDEVLKDLVVFHAHSDLGHNDAIRYYQSLGDKLGRTDLLAGLADAYIAAGNKAAAVATLAEVTAGGADIVRLAKLLEESYGLRNWSAYGDAMAKTKVATLKGQPEEGVKEVHKILTRLAVQLDAERVTTPDLADEFVGTADLFVRLFPKDETAFKMAAGTVLALKEPERKIERLEHLLANTELGLKQDQKLTLREQLVSLYQKQSAHVDAAKHAGIAATEATAPAEIRRYRFVQASELYDGGKEQEALPLLQAIAKENAADDFGTKSGMLAVRILGKAGDYAAAMAQSKTWMQAVEPNGDVKASKEYAAVVEVSERSEFEWAAAQGDKPEALEVFRKFCVKKAFLPQSCDNAKSLAVKLKSYDVLISLLTLEQNHEELAIVYESNGYFDRAAEYHEGKLSADKSSVTDYLHVVILYEIAGRLDGRDRVLDKLVQRVERSKFATADEEALVYNTLKETGRLSPRLMALPWTAERKCALADQLEQTTPGQKQIRETLLACQTSPGPSWVKLVSDDVASLDDKQRKIGFYGNGSKSKFERRLAAVNTMAKTIDRFLPGADHATYLALAERARKAFEDLSAEIAATPIPPEADVEMLPQIAAALEEMATPFNERAQAYADLMTKEKERLAATPAPAPALADFAPLKPVERPLIENEIKTLNNDPSNREALVKMQATYEQHGNKRVSAYFRGRIEQLESKTF